MRPPARLMLKPVYWYCIDVEYSPYLPPKGGAGGKTVRIRFVLGTAPGHVSIPPNQNGTMAKGR